MSQRTHSARLHALAAALCALLLLVALGLMDANRAPWWALVATQGMLLVVTASAGMWLDRAQGAGDRRQATEGEDGMGAWGQQRRWTTMRYMLPRDDDDVFWPKRLGNQKEETP